MGDETEDSGEEEPGRGHPQLPGTNSRPAGNSQRPERSGKGEAAKSDGQCLPDHRGLGSLAFPQNRSPSVPVIRQCVQLYELIPDRNGKITQ